MMDQSIHFARDEDDVVIEHAVLNLEGQSKQFLNFHSSAFGHFEKKLLKGKQILLSSENHAVLSKNDKKTSFLTCQHFRQLSLGMLQIELLPSGHSMGSSFLRIEKQNTSLLYASFTSLREGASQKRAQTKKSDTLLIKLHKDPSVISAKSSQFELERFVKFVQKIVTANENVSCVIDGLSHSHYLIHHLSGLNFNVYCDDKILSFIKESYKAVPSNQKPEWLKKLRALNSELTYGPGVILLTKQKFLKSRSMSHHPGLWVWIGSDIHLVKTANKMNYLHISENFLIDTEPDLQEISTIVKDTSPQTVLVFGEGAQTCIHHLAKIGFNVEAFSPPKVDTLF